MQTVNTTGGEDPDPGPEETERERCPRCGQYVPVGPGRRLAKHPRSRASTTMCKGTGFYVGTDKPPHPWEVA